MSEAAIYRLLNRPWLYRLAQSLLVPGGEKHMSRGIRSVLRRLPPGERILEVGCGPYSRLWALDQTPVGLDLSLPYIASYRRISPQAVAASAAEIPFRDRFFDGFWSLGLLHHLPDPVARQVIGEALRVVRPGGYVVFFDLHLAPSVLRRPIPWGVGRLDRGRHQRRREVLAALFPDAETWHCEPLTFSLYRYEGGFYIHRKQ